MRSPFKLLVFSAFLFFLLTVSFPWVSASSEDVATLAITQAEETLASAFEAVLDAEEAGANVSGLLGSLNFGGEYLAEAYVWYRLGVFENASRFADLCFELWRYDVDLDGFRFDDRYVGIWLNMTAS